MEENLGKYQGDWIVADISSNAIISENNSNPLTSSENIRDSLHLILQFRHVNLRVEG